MFMSKFSRSWTQHLKTDKQGFKKAFNKVIRKSKLFELKTYGLLGTNAIGEDCRGEVRGKSFFIYRKGRRWYYGRVEGDIKEEENGITLGLQFCSGVNYFRLTSLALLFSVMVYIPVLDLQVISNPTDSIWFLVFFFYLPVYAVVFWLLYLWAQRQLNKQHSYFLLVLKEIEKHIM